MPEPARDPVPDAILDRLVDRNDLDGLVREVDRRTDARNWDGLVRLRDRARAAFDRGFQLWPAASLAEYRLALRAPGPWAGAVVVEGAGRFALGPLAEVAASTHTWSELAPHLAPGPLAGMVAHERVVRGEDRTEDDVPFGDVLDLPLRLASWEPPWPVAEYHDSELVAPRPALPTLTGVRLPAAGCLLDDGDGTVSVLRAIVTPWITQSNGRVEAVCVEGSALAAIAALGVPRARVAELPAVEALAQIAWAAASGGAHGRRRGAAVGREHGWIVAAALAGESDRASELRWFAWDDALPAVGWDLRLAVEDRDDGIAWAVAASDHS